MRRFALIVRHCLIVFCIVRALPAAADPPGCGGLVPADAPIPPELLTYCATNPGCDLLINPWDPVTHRSPDIGVGDPISDLPERPRFFFDAAENRYYTKLFTKFTGFGSGPAPAGQVTVDLFVKLTADPAQASDPTGWVALGTYAMSIPPPGSSGFGVLFPGSVHAQQSPVCWSLAAGVDIPRQFLVKAQIHWPSDSDATDDVAFSLYNLESVERLAQIAFAMDLSGSMDEILPGGGSKLTEAKDKANLFASLVEAGNQLGAYGFATDNPANTTPPLTATYKDSAAASHIATLGDTSEIAAIRTIRPGIDGVVDRLAITGAISSQTAHGCTPVGQGLLRARAGLATLPP